MIDRGTALALATAAVLGAASGCGSAEESASQASRLLTAQAAELAAELEEHGDVDKSDLVVRLAFGSEADLDLYVTDPLLETVYFANRKARSGGRITADLRCDAPAPRVEELRFEAPLPGRYRVGIDHPARCDDGVEPVAYAVSVRGPGLRRGAQGSIAVEEFLLVALEFDVLETGAPSR